MPPPSSDVFNIGAICFGLVIGWITYRTLRRADSTGISDIATVLGAVGGGAVLGIFERGDSFGWYAMGLAAGFFLYLGIAFLLDRDGTKTWMGGSDRDHSDPNGPVDRN